MILVSEGSETKIIAAPTVMYSEWIWFDSTCLWWAPQHPSILAFVTFFKTHDQIGMNKNGRATEAATFSITLANVDKGTGM